MAVSKRLRYEILRRDNHACRYCGATAPDVKLNVDHVIPQALGGTDKPDNLVTSCADCNAGKTSSMPNAMPVADVDQDDFRRAKELKDRAVSEHLWRGGYPPQWGPRQIERYVAEEAWRYAWSVASRGGDPTHDQYSEFLVHAAALFEIGHCAAEVLCAAVHAGTHLTPHLSWGLRTTDVQYASISGEQCSRISGVFEGWLEEWRQRGWADPSAEQQDQFRGELVMAARNGDSRENIQIASGMAAASRSSQLDEFLAQWADADNEPVGGEL
ncbi:HNH endonuclease [Streptomyces sp. NPDC056105]|uniref:HNH endonuclease n=1 Tax=Streptomyces sp. NPDC056105 TaxID=3345714 RepID=UPI0035D578A4